MDPLSFRLLTPTSCRSFTLESSDIQLNSNCHKATHLILRKVLRKKNPTNTKKQMLIMWTITQQRLTFVSLKHTLVSFNQREKLQRVHHCWSSDGTAECWTDIIVSRRRSLIELHFEPGPWANQVQTSKGVLQIPKEEKVSHVEATEAISATGMKGQVCTQGRTQTASVGSHWMHAGWGVLSEEEAAKATQLHRSALGKLE